MANEDTILEEKIFKQIKESERRIAQLRNREPQIVANSKTAMVLCGGGAKGAYQFGALLAIRRFSNYQIDMISGTSVGAINALLWATDSFDVGKRLYKTLSFGSSYPRSRFFKWIPLRFYWLFGAFWFAVSIVAHNMWGKITPSKMLNVIAGICSTCIFLAPIVFGTLFLVVTEPSMFLNDWRMQVLLIGLALVLLRSSWLRGTARSSGTDSQFIAFTWLVTALPLSIAPGVVIGVWACSLLPEWVPYFVFGFAYATLLVIFAFMIFFGFRRLSSRLSSGTILLQTPLRRKITQVLSDSNLKVPVYVCTASHFEFVENYSDEVHKKHLEKVAEYQKGNAPFEMPPADPFVTKSNWAPEYVCLNDQSIPDRVNYVCASAALPFGIVPNVEIGNKIFVDGGVVDNVPIAAIAGLAEHCVIILLDQFSSDADALASVGIRSHDQGRFVFKEQTLGIQFLFSSVTVFYPSKSLGGLLSGTLNFRATYARRRIVQGYRDTKRKLRQLKLSK